jgi:pimeloyl-ACP methyl ester carboxylesterase
MFYVGRQKVNIGMEKTITVDNHTCRALVSTKPGVPLVFLHGYSFTSDVWKEIGVLSLLKEQQIPFFALDLPYGAQSQCRPKTRIPQVTVSVIRQSLSAFFGDEEVFLVGASLGGYMALHYATQYPVKGLLLIAPVHSAEPILTQRYPSLSNVTIIYGSTDTIVSFQEMKTLAHQLPNANLLVYERAGHPAYLHNPKRFLEDLITAYTHADTE